MSQLLNEGIRAEDAPGRLVQVYSSLDEETGEVIAPVGRTKQEFKDEVDINSIVKVILKTGKTDWLEANQAWMQQVGDTEVGSMTYKEVMDVVAGSAERFAELPSDVRSGFNNEASQFLDFVQGRGGVDELAAMIVAARSPVVKKGSVHEGSKPTGEALVVDPVVEDSPSSGGDEV